MAERRPWTDRILLASLILLAAGVTYELGSTTFDSAGGTTLDPGAGSIRAFTNNHESVVHVSLLASSGEIDGFPVDEQPLRLNLLIDAPATENNDEIPFAIEFSRPAAPALDPDWGRVPVIPWSEDPDSAADSDSYPSHPIWVDGSADDVELWHMRVVPSEFNDWTTLVVVGSFRPRTTSAGGNSHIGYATFVIRTPADDIVPTSSGVEFQLPRLEAGYVPGSTIYLANRFSGPGSDEPEPPSEPMSLLLETLWTDTEGTSLTIRIDDLSPTDEVDARPDPSLVDDGLALWNAQSGEVRGTLNEGQPILSESLSVRGSLERRSSINQTRTNEFRAAALVGLSGGLLVWSMELSLAAALDYRREVQRKKKAPDGGAKAELDPRGYR